MTVSGWNCLDPMEGNPHRATSRPHESAGAERIAIDAALAQGR